MRGQTAFVGAARSICTVGVVWQDRTNADGVQTGQRAKRTRQNRRRAARKTAAAREAPATPEGEGHWATRGHRVAKWTAREGGAGETTGVWSKLNPAVLQLRDGVCRVGSDGDNLWRQFLMICCHRGNVVVTVAVFIALPHVLVTLL